MPVYNVEYYFDLNLPGTASQEAKDYMGKVFTQIKTAEEHMAIYRKVFDFLITWPKNSESFTDSWKKLDAAFVVDFSDQLEVDIPGNEKFNLAYDLQFLKEKEVGNNYSLFELTAVDGKSYKHVLEWRRHISRINFYNNNPVNIALKSFTPLNKNSLCELTEANKKTVEDALNNFEKALKDYYNGVDQITNDEGYRKWVFDTCVTTFKPYVAATIINDVLSQIEIYFGQKSGLSPEDAMKQYFSEYFVKEFDEFVKGEEQKDKDKAAADKHWIIASFRQLEMKYNSLTVKELIEETKDFCRQCVEKGIIKPIEEVFKKMKIPEEFLETTIKNYKDRNFQGTLNDYNDRCATPFSYSTQYHLYRLVQHLFEAANNLLDDLPVKLKIGDYQDPVKLYTCQKFQDIFDYRDLNSSVAPIFNSILMTNQNAEFVGSKWRFNAPGFFLALRTALKTIAKKATDLSPRPVVDVNFIDENNCASIAFLFPPDQHLYFSPISSSVLESLDYKTTFKNKKNGDVETKIEVQSIDLENFSLNGSIEGKGVTKYTRRFLAETYGASILTLINSCLKFEKAALYVVNGDGQVKGSGDWSGKIESEKISSGKGIAITNQYKFIFSTSGAAIDLLLSSDKRGRGTGTGFRSDSVNDEDYLWDYIGKDDADQINGIKFGVHMFGLSKDRLISNLDKSIRTTVVYEEEKQIGTKLGFGAGQPLKYNLIKYKPAGKELYFMETQLPRRPLNGDAYDLLFKFRYWRRIYLDRTAGSDESYNYKILKRIDGAKYSPKSKDDVYPFPNGLGYDDFIPVNPPIVFQYMDNDGILVELNKPAFSSNKNLRKKVKHKGVNIGMKQTRKGMPGKEMAKILNYVAVEGLKTGLSASSAISASTFALNTISNGAGLTAKTDWQETKIPAASQKYAKYHIGQDWCHLQAVSLSGVDRVGNLVSGSSYCNTEQLAMETPLMSVPMNKYMLKITAYLLKDNSMNGNYLSGADDKYVKLAYEVNNSIKSTAKQAVISTDGGRQTITTNKGGEEFDTNTFPNAPVAAFIRYKIYRASPTELVLDYIIDAQSEFFDKLQNKMLGFIVKTLITEDEEALNMSSSEYNVDLRSDSDDGKSGKKAKKND